MRSDLAPGPDLVFPNSGVAFFNVETDEPIRKFQVRDAFFFHPIINTPDGDIEMVGESFLGNPRAVFRIFRRYLFSCIVQCMHIDA